MKTKILVIDDDLIAVPHVVDELRMCGLSVDLMSDATQIRALLEMDGPPPADFFVIDVMMDLREVYSLQETRAGLYTGVFLATDVRAKWPHVPLVLWSAAMLKFVKEAAAKSAQRISNCAFVSKGELLEDVIDSYFKRGRFGRRWMERLWGAVTLSPNIAGVGLDVKKLRNK